MLLRTLLAAAVAGIAAVAPPFAGVARAADGPAATIPTIDAPHVVLAGRPFDVLVTVVAGAADLDATAAITAAGAVAGTAHVAAPAGGTVTVRVPTTLAGSGATRFDVAVADATGTGTVTVADYAAVPGGWTGPALAGHGGQFNQNVYAELSRKAGVSEENVRTMERAVLGLHPQFSRIFFNPAAFNDPDLMSSFVRTVLFAQRTGTTINVTWQSGKLDVASGTIPKFANVLVDLVSRRHVTNLRWVTIQNEPNSTRMSPGAYELMYRALDRSIQSIRGQVRFMGGDLVRGEGGPGGQRYWLTYFADHMADILDAYSIHVFWDYWDSDKLEERLTEVRAIVDSLPEAGRKPLYVTEYGVRGADVFNGSRLGEPGVWEDGTAMCETNVSAFQHAWFDLVAARLGYVATSKWDLYFGRYDKASQAHYLVGDPRYGWPKHPLYNLLALLTATVKPGWHAAQLDGAPGTKLVTAYVGPTGQWTLLGLDRSGGQLNGPSATTVPFAIGGLPPGTPFRLVLWNEVGDGLDSAPVPVWTDADGVATLAVPQHAVFALTTIPGSILPRTDFLAG